MSELKEFAVALIDQLSLETNEEKNISELIKKIDDDEKFNYEFKRVEQSSSEIFQNMKKKIKEFTGFEVSPKLSIKYLNLIDFKKLKNKKVFPTEDSNKYVNDLFNSVIDGSIENITDIIKKNITKFLVYSTYVKSYISKISTTYGDYLDNIIYLNKFIIESYPKIILYKQGKPYEQKFNTIKSAYNGALKMTILEEQIHSIQDDIYELNKKAVKTINMINEKLSKIILDLDDHDVEELSQYLKLESIPNEFPIAKRANLFFMLNPDNFIVNVLGPDVMTFNRIEVDSKIIDIIPQLSELYHEWLKPIQLHHAIFSIMEGMTEFITHNVLIDDKDFQEYIKTYVGHDMSAYKIKKNSGNKFIQIVFNKFGKNTFHIIMKNIPTIKELTDPNKYIERINI